MTKTYIRRPVGDTELRDLTDLTMEEERAFFKRNPHLVTLYRGRLMLVALCQGAALQYLGQGRGVNDFDVHFFYAQNPEKKRLSRAIKHIHADVGTFKAVRVDFIRTVVPRTESGLGPDVVVARIRRFLVAPPTPNAKHLREKAVIGLHPKPVFGLQIWPLPPARN